MEDMNGQPEILARCGYCDYISYESTVKEHVNLEHEGNNITNRNDYDEESVVEEFNESSTTDMVVEEACNTNTHHWSDSEIKLLISLYTDYRQDFDGKKLTNKSIWQKIALEFNKNGSTVSWEQCDNKFKNLKKAYKKVVDNNSKTGRGKLSFKYFEVMDLLFCKNPEIHPLSECSSMETPRSMESFSEPQSPVSTASGAATPVPDELPGITPKRGKSLKRKQAKEEPTWFKKFREDAERRHQEKMDVQNKFVSVLERFLLEK